MLKKTSNIAKIVVERKRIDIKIYKKFKNYGLSKSTKNYKLYLFKLEDQYIKTINWAKKRKIKAKNQAK